jgi:hypothetical protein
MQILPKAAKSLFTEVGVFDYQKTLMGMVITNLGVAQSHVLFDFLPL